MFNHRIILAVLACALLAAPLFAQDPQPATPSPDVAAPAPDATTPPVDRDRKSVV